MAALAILNFFLINMFVGVLGNQFVEAKENTSPEKNYFITNEQKKWIIYQNLIRATNIKKSTPEMPKNKFRAILFKITRHRGFDIFLMFCIIANIIVMGLNYEGAPSSYNTILENINYFFTAVFIVEFLLKIIAFGYKTYFSSNWNKFDFGVVFCSVAEIIITNSITGSVTFLRVGPQIIRVMRVIRVTRVLKLVRKFQGLTKLIETLIATLPSIANVGALYLLVFYIYAILGVFLFQDIAYGEIIDDLNNFHNVWYSFMICFRMVTGENWWVIMFDCSNSYPDCIYGQTCGTGIYFFNIFRYFRNSIIYLSKCGLHYISFLCKLSNFSLYKACLF